MKEEQLNKLSRLNKLQDFLRENLLLPFQVRKHLKHMLSVENTEKHKEN